MQIANLSCAEHRSLKISQRAAIAALVRARPSAATLP